MSKRRTKAQGVKNSSEKPTGMIIPLYPDIRARKIQRENEAVIKDSSIVTLEASIITSYEILKKASLSDWERRNIDAFYKSAIQSINTLKRFI